MSSRDLKKYNHTTLLGIDNSLFDFEFIIRKRLPRGFCNFCNAIEAGGRERDSGTWIRERDFFGHDFGEGIGFGRRAVLTFDISGHLGEKLSAIHFEGREIDCRQELRESKRETSNI